MIYYFEFIIIHIELTQSYALVDLSGEQEPADMSRLHWGVNVREIFGQYKAPFMSRTKKSEGRKATPAL